jgi:polysaccharide biosynthesis/export protein
MRNKKQTTLIYRTGFLSILILSVVSASAQKPADSTVSAGSSATTALVTPNQTATPPVRNRTATPAEDQHYRIGPGDVLDIRILNRPNLSRDSVRVEGNGTIRMPLIDTPIQAACMSESELAKEIAGRYLKFYRNPQVDVFIKEFKSSQVAVLGSVNEQGRFLLQRRIRLLELLTFAKGPIADHAGQTINVVHSGNTFQCDDGNSRDKETATGLSTYRLSDTLRGEESANPYLENGDIVTLPEADQVYVVGNVLAPRTILLREPITLTRAIAMSGGLAQDTKTSRIRIVRQEPGSATKTEIYVDLATIEKKKAEDIALMPNDIVDVPISGTKSLLRSLIGGIAPAVSQLPVRVVP